jgi:hypothetical protein
MKENESVIGAMDFYQKVADLLKCDDHIYIETYKKRTRWNNRKAGNGRFSNHGLVRYYNSKNIHISLYNPKLSGLFNSVESALEAIKNAKLAAFQPPSDQN